MTQRGLPLQTRLELASMPITECGCWIWMNRIMPNNGYGVINVENRTWLAHRVSWETYRGPIPEGISVLHRCDVRPCINPDHLFLGTYKDNSDDMIAKGRKCRCDGQHNGHAKLTAADVNFIRSTPPGTRGLSERFQVTRSAICRARKGSTWSTLENQPLSIRIK